MTDNPKANPNPKKAAKTFPVRMIRAYWPKDGSEMLPPGTSTELPVEEALAIIEAGIAERNDALPSV